MIQDNRKIKTEKKPIIGYKAPAVHKAFELLRAVAQSPKSLGIIELSQKLGYSKSTTHGLVHALLREGVLAQGPGARKLFLGPTIAELLFSDWQQEKVISPAQPLLNEIRDAVNETVILGINFIVWLSAGAVIGWFARGMIKLEHRQTQKPLPGEDSSPEKG